MALIKGLWYWAYLDDENRIIVKQYTDDRVIENTEKLPFCRGIFGPFEAYDMQHARQLCHERYAQENR
jgi:hypothetical protein